MSKKDRNLNNKGNRILSKLPFPAKLKCGHQLSSDWQTWVTNILCISLLFGACNYRFELEYYIFIEIGALWQYIFGSYVVCFCRCLFMCNVVDSADMLRHKSVSSSIVMIWIESFLDKRKKTVAWEIAAKGTRSKYHTCVGLLRWRCLVFFVKNHCRENFTPRMISERYMSCLEWKTVWCI